MLNKGKKLDLRTVPSAIGGDPTQRKGIILAKSIPAKKFNVITGEPLYQATRKCPNLIILSPDFKLYESCHMKFINILKSYICDIEVASIDECYLDYTSYEKIYGDVLSFAHMIKDKIKEELGFTVNVGIGENKLLAKMASDFSKPDKVHTLFKDEIPAKLWSLPMSELFMLGKKSEKKLASIGFKTIYDIANSDKNNLYKLMGKQGLMLWNFANGVDFSKIETSHTLKSISSSETLAYDMTTKKEAYSQILRLSEDIGQRLRSYNFSSFVLSVEIKNSEFMKYSHQKKLDIPTNCNNTIYEISKKMFDELWKNEPIRSIALNASCLIIGKSEQLNMFELLENYKNENVDKVVDSIRKKYNKSVITRGSLL